MTTLKEEVDIDRKARDAQIKISVANKFCNRVFYWELRGVIHKSSCNEKRTHRGGCSHSAVCKNPLCYCKESFEHD